MRSLLRRGRVWVLLLSTSGGALALQACDPGVRDTVLGGVSTAATSLATTFIQAFFQSLATDNQDNGGPTTV
jgi:hypothetical protein